MTDIGEAISIALIRLEEDKCVFCGEQHQKRKKDEIKPTGWKRAAISGVGGNFAAKKKAMYPDNTSPPSAYRAEGHHCLAFSSFIVDARTAPKDRFAALNHYLKEKGYDPNNENNTIDLPGRKQDGDNDDHAQFKEFEKAVLAGKPLQLHIGGHGKDFMMASTLEIRDLVNVVKKAGLCKLPDDSFKQQLLDGIIVAEDSAFKLTASAESPWIAHPTPLKDAERYVKNKHNISEIVYPKL